MTGPTPLFWLLWALTVGTCVVQMARGWRGGKSILGLPFLACGMWLYFYGFMAYSAATNLGDFLPSWTMEFGQFMSILSLAGLLSGWRLTIKKEHHSTPRYVIPERHYPGIWCAGLALLVIANVGHYTFNAQETIDYKATSNYWYLSFLAGYPAVALCLLALVKSKLGKETWTWALLFLLTTMLMWHNIITARRGPLLPMVIILVYLPYLLRKKSPARVVVGVSMAASAFIMLTFVYIRPYTYAPDAAVRRTWSETLQGWSKGLSELSFDAVVVSKQKQIADNEFVYHCGMIGTIWKVGDYEYGTGYLSLLTHWIPRQLWPSKPALEEGWFPSTWDVEMPGVMGWSMTTGASGGGVADVFGEFGLLTPLFWAFLGSIGARLYSRARWSGDVLASTQYVGFLAASHWLIAQGFGAMFVPACFFILIPTAVLARYRIRDRARKRPEFRRPFVPDLGAVTTHPTST